MSYNCKVEKVKGVINNDNLPYLNGIRLNIQTNEYSNIYKLTLAASSAIEVKCGEDGYFAESVAGLENNRIRTKAGTSMELYFPCLDFKADIKGKDKITSIKLVPLKSDGTSASVAVPLAIIDTRDLIGIGTLSTLQMTGLMGGRIENLKDINVTANANVYVAFCQFSDDEPNISNLPKGAKYYYTQESNIVGNTADIAELGVMDTLDIQNDVTGSIEELVAAYQAKSLDNKSINTVIPTSLSFGTGSNKITMNYYLQGNISWNGSMISLICSRAPNNTKVYEKNATNEQITTWQAAGKTVTDVDTGTIYPPTNQ